MVCKFLLLIYLVLPTYYCFLMRSNNINGLPLILILVINNCVLPIPKLILWKPQFLMLMEHKFSWKKWNYPFKTNLSNYDKTFNYPLHTAIDTLEPLFGVQPVKAAILNSKFSKVELAMSRYGGILTHTSSVSTNSSSRIDLADNNNPPIEIDDPTYLQYDRKKKEMISIDEPFLHHHFFYYYYW